MEIAMISCTKAKTNYKCPARELYSKSNLFKKAVMYIEKNHYDNWYVLSAKHGLVDKDREIEPYEVTLNNMKAEERKRWANLVYKQTLELNLNLQEIDFYAGKKYREYLIPHFQEKGIKCNVPLEGMGIGEQLQFYKNKLIEK